MRALAAVAAALLSVGCGGGDENGGDEERAIRDWSAAVNAGRYERAASFFVDGAIVEQAREIRLENRKDAIAFNSSLPCKADVTDVDDEGRTVIAAFRLRGGPAGGCDGGSARVRFRFRDGKFIEWRQLGEPQAPPGAAA